MGLSRLTDPSPVVLFWGWCVLGSGCAHNDSDEGSIA